MESALKVINKMTENNKEAKAKPNTNQNKRKVMDVNFIAPDGGWGWFVVVAAGCSNVSEMRVIVVLLSENIHVST